MPPWPGVQFIWFACLSLSCDFITVNSVLHRGQLVASLLQCSVKSDKRMLSYYAE